MQNYSLNWDDMTSDTVTIQQAVQLGIVTIGSNSDSTHRDVEILLQQALGVSRAYLYTHSDKQLSSEQLICFQHYINKRAQGMPIAYITGQRDFWTLTLAVTEDTLIPRPETELLIEKALALLDANAPISVLDLGTGSGAIALAIASERPHWQITACDKHIEALRVASQSAQTLNLTQVVFLCSDWFQALDNRLFHAILSNPPYLAPDDPHLQQGDLRFEPQTALVSDDNGLEALHLIIKQSYHHLHEQGILLIEHGYEQGAIVSALLRQYGYVDIQCWQDWQGHDRISGGRRNK